MRAIFQTSNQYQGLLDLQGNVVYANTTALAGIRAVTQDVVGKPFWETPWFAETKGMRDIILGAFAAVKAGESVRTEMLLHLPTGDRYFDFSMRHVFDQHGIVSGILPEAVDITERRQSEEALSQSQKMEAVGQLTGGIAHDFNNLLTIIRSATDFLGRRDLPEDRRRRYTDAISDTVDRASKLTGQLLAFARRQPLIPQVFNVGAQVESIAQLIRPLVGGRIKFDLDLCMPECFAIADVAQFETTLINLAVNARDAMGGEGRLSIIVKTVDAVPALPPIQAARANSSRCRSLTPAPASQRINSRPSLSRSSPPRKLGKAPDSDLAEHLDLLNSPVGYPGDQHARRGFELHHLLTASRKPLYRYGSECSDFGDGDEWPWSLCSGRGGQ